MKRSNKKSGLLRNTVLTALATVIGYSPLEAQPSPIWVTYKGQKTSDFNNSRKVDLDDFFLFAEAFGDHTKKRYDLDNDGLINFDDFFLFANDFGKEVKSIPIIEEIPKIKASQVNLMNNPGTINLSDYVSDPLEDPFNIELVPVNNNLITTMANNEIRLRPRNTFSGETYIIFKIKKDGQEPLESKIDVMIERDEEAMRHYKQLTRDAPDKWKEPFDVLIYTGPAKQSGDSIHPRTWTGPKITEQRKQFAIKAASETVHKLTGSFFKKTPNIRLTDNPNELWDNRKGLDFYWDNSLPGGGGATNYDRDPQGFIYSASIRLTTSTFLSDESTYSHEIANAIGLSDARDEDSWSISSRTSTNVEPHPKDIFVGTAYYDQLR